MKKISLLLLTMACLSNIIISKDIEWDFPWEDRILISQSNIFKLDDPCTTLSTAKQKTVCESTCWDGPGLEKTGSRKATLKAWECSEGEQKCLCSDKVKNDSKVVNPNGSFEFWCSGDKTVCAWPGYWSDGRHWDNIKDLKLPNINNKTLTRGDEKKGSEEFCKSGLEGACKNDGDYIKYRWSQNKLHCRCKSPLVKK